MIVNDLLEALETWPGDTQVLILTNMGVGHDLQFVETYESELGQVLLLVPGIKPGIPVKASRRDPASGKIACHRCMYNGKLSHPFSLQTYAVDAPDLNLSLLINVTAAYNFARLNLSPIVIPEHLHRELIAVNMSETFCGAHVDHVDRTRPAIMGTYDNRLMLMDGTHRLCAWVKNRETPLAYQLDEKQTRMFIMNKVALGL